MNTLLRSQTDPATLPAAVEIIKAGGVVAFPTDTVYGIGVMANSIKAIDRLYQIKGRSFDKPIPVMIGRMEQLDLIVGSVPQAARRLAERFWPGPLTLVLPKNPDLPVNLTHLPTVGVRIPNHEFTLALLGRCGPLAVTSANLSGRSEALNTLEVMNQLGGSLELIVDGGTSPGRTASTVVDFSGSSPQILRKGPITEKMIELALKDPVE
ncbi:MAG: L-threonylcarbamoyladenylate synthase [Anaerolineaceae bacterium]